MGVVAAKAYNIERVEAISLRRYEFEIRLVYRLEGLV